jgi:hypothetical protein
LAVIKRLLGFVVDIADLGFVDPAMRVQRVRLPPEVVGVHTASVASPPLRCKIKGTLTPPTCARFVHPRDVDIWEYYGKVGALIEALRTQRKDDLAGQVESALRGGATSGEILGSLSITLPTVGAAVPALAEQADALARWARDAIS